MRPWRRHRKCDRTCVGFDCAGAYAGQKYLAPFETVIPYGFYHLGDILVTAKEDDLHRIIWLKLLIEGLQTSMDKFNVSRPTPELERLSPFLFWSSS